MTTNSQGKRKGPNGMFWGNILLRDSVGINAGKCIMAECINDDDKLFRVWTNSKKSFSKAILINNSKNTKVWNASIDRIGWYYADLNESDITFYDF